LLYIIKEFIINLFFNIYTSVDIIEFKEVFIHFLEILSYNKFIE